MLQKNAYKVNFREEMVHFYVDGSIRERNYHHIAKDYMYCQEEWDGDGAPCSNMAEPCPDLEQSDKLSSCSSLSPEFFLLSTGIR